MLIKRVKVEYKKKLFLMFQGSLKPKIRFIGVKVCSVLCVQTDIHIYENRGHPFRVSRISLQPTIKDLFNKQNELLPSQNITKNQCLLIPFEKPWEKRNKNISF